MENTDKKLCKCGCGKNMKGHWDHGDHGKFVFTDYLRGHNRIGYKPTEEHIRNQSLSHIGQKPWNKGKTASEETKEKLRIAHLGQRNMKGYKHRPESIEKMRIAKIGKRASQETKIKMGESQKGHVTAQETRDKISNTHRGLWKNPNHARKMGCAWKVKPNKPESIILNLLENIFPGQWKYTGDFSFTINGKAPDFVNCNGQKKIIELFGDYWHRGENPEDRAAIFEPFGYETLVIWEHELKRLDSVKNRIERFCSYENQ